MNHMTKYCRLTLTVVALGTLMCACKSNKEETVLSYPDGTPRLVYIMKENGNDREIVGEKSYYENGNIRWEKHFRDSKRDGRWRYYYASGQLFGEGLFDTAHQLGRNWAFYRADGSGYCDEGCDSVVVNEFSENDFLPSAIACCKGNAKKVYMFYEDFSKRYEGETVDGLREGHCTFFFPNGVTQTEAIYADGELNGVYIVYRENGTPYYRGVYINGKRAAVWEFYDEEGNLVNTKDFQ